MIDGKTEKRRGERLKKMRAGAHVGDVGSYFADFCAKVGMRYEKLMRFLLFVGELMRKTCEILLFVGRLCYFWRSFGGLVVVGGCIRCFQLLPPMTGKAVFSEQ